MLRSTPAPTALSILVLAVTLQAAVSSHGVAAQEVDLSAIPLFWETAAILESDREPTAAEWSRLFEHPGYRQIQRSGNRATVMRSVMPYVFMPSRRPGLDSLLADTSTALFARLERRVASHLDEARRRRSELESFARRVSAEAPVARAAKRALAYVPADRRGGLAEPAVYVLLFEDNGFGGGSLALDLLNLMEQSPESRIGYLGHELHHAYMGQLDRSRNPGMDDPYRLVYHALSALHLEGVASLIDKPAYLDPTARAALPGDERASAEEFAALYQTTPQLLARVDSVLAGIQRGTLSAQVSGPELRAMLPWGGHPTGMYMARTVERVLGRERLVAASDPFTFVLDYQEAALSSEAPAFSAPAVALVRRLRERYVPQGAGLPGRDHDAGPDHDRAGGPIQRPAGASTGEQPSGP